ncbi:MAG: DUF547 domain-containing protein [Elainellaceae cyanobacterium]
MMDVLPWDNLLHRYVDRQGQVDYCRWQQEGRGELDDWLGRLTASDVEGDEAAQIAAWINIYNALVVAQILRRYPVNSIRSQIFGIPNWIGFLWFFLGPVHAVCDRRYSLNHIEQRILKRRFNEPRVHFALVCGALGAPRLRPEAYCADRVRQQLEEDAAQFINTPAHVTYDPKANLLSCSKLFKWHRKSFLRAASSLPAYISCYLPQDRAIKASTPLRYLPYDLSLNDIQR